ncbi:MAG: hypothetical protein JWM93_670 [Frankiales bacterium]|nr:hypothetical protein [Frankiales bacterium]
MSEPHDHPYDHNSSSDGHGHIPGPVRSALGLLADGLDKARNLAGPAGEKARHVTDKVRDASAETLDKVRDEGTHVVNKLRGHSSSGSGTSDAYTSSADRSGSAQNAGHDRAAEAFDIAKTVGAALLVGAVKAVQLAMKEWQAHTGNASTPEENAPRARAAWDTAGTPKAPPTANAFGATDESVAPTAEPQPAPEVNNWADIEAEAGGGDVWAEETDRVGAAGGTGTDDPVAGATVTEHDSDDVVFTTESELFGATPAATAADVDAGPALRAEPEPAHSGHGARSGPGEAGATIRHDEPGHTHSDAPLEGFDEMTIGSLRGRLGSLSLNELESLRDYERSHAIRPQVLTMLENRIAKVTAHSGEELGGEA